MLTDGCTLSSRWSGYFFISGKCLRKRKTVDLFKMVGKDNLFSYTPCRSVEDVLSFVLEIGSFCFLAATKTFDFVVFFGDETFRNQKRR
jgi:hypothetical protein